MKTVVQKTLKVFIKFYDLRLISPFSALNWFKKAKANYRLQFTRKILTYNWFYFLSLLKDIKNSN